MKITVAVEAVFGFLMMWRFHAIDVMVVLEGESARHKLYKSFVAGAFFTVIVIIATSVKRVALDAGDDLSCEKGVAAIRFPLSLHEKRVVQLLFFAVLDRALMGKI
jgi:hypothetical protein